MATPHKAGWSPLPWVVAVIFVTVGSQLPFDRMVAAVDAWSARATSRPDVLAQVGAGRADYQHLRCERFVDDERYGKELRSARLVVAHAGIGSVMAASEAGIPVIVVPREHRRGECVNDHQVQTARQLERMGVVQVAWRIEDLPALIDAEMARSEARRPARRPTVDLVEHLRAYVRNVLEK